MGASLSQCLTEEDIEELKASTDIEFSRTELSLLYERFQVLDKKKKGMLSSAEFMSIPELAMNPIGKRLVGLFDRDKRDRVNFRDFVRGLWIFSSKCPWARKLEAAFMIYDVDGDGMISKDDLLKILKMNVGPYLTMEELESISLKTIAEADPERKGFLTIEDFADAIGKDKVQTMMSLDFKGLMLDNI